MAKKWKNNEDEFFGSLSKFSEKESKPEPEELSDEEMIQRMAACGFTNREMALQLGIEYGEFKMQAETKESDFWTAIQAGKLQSEFMLVDKQRQLAESGNITAAQTFLKIKEAKDILAIKNRIWFGT